jgi:hypothetical protein
MAAREALIQSPYDSSIESKPPADYRNFGPHGPFHANSKYNGDHAAGDRPVNTPDMICIFIFLVLKR